MRSTKNLVLTPGSTVWWQGVKYWLIEITRVAYLDEYGIRRVIPVARLAHIEFSTVDMVNSSFVVDPAELTVAMDNDFCFYSEWWQALRKVS